MGGETTVQRGKYLILFAGFFGWLFAGAQLGLTSIVMRTAMQDLMPTAAEDDLAKWFGWLVSAFLLGGAAGGYLFGALGDRIGRKRTMSLSIATYTVFSGLMYFIGGPWQLLLLRFLVGLGVGGMWPNGIALVSEAWPGLSRPMLAGAIGTAANIGIMLFSIVTWYHEVTQDDWRWVASLTSWPILLAALVWLLVPESARWLASRNEATVTNEPPENKASTPSTSPLEVFQPQFLRVTLLGIVLGTIPLFGGWGNANWANAWASQVGDQKVVSVAADNTNDTDTTDNVEAAKMNGPPNKQQVDAGLKARAMLARSGPGSLASLLGGALAIFIGRRKLYFFLCIACFVCSQYLFTFSEPGRSDFLWSMAALGFFSGFFFGWLPLCLPELFPTRIRATGAGVSFNFGRIATAIGILVAAGFLKTMFDGDYPQIGRITSSIYIVGAVAICFAPDTSRDGLTD